MVLAASLAWCSWDKIVAANHIASSPDCVIFYVTHYMTRMKAKIIKIIAVCPANFLAVFCRSAAIKWNEMKMFQQLFYFTCVAGFSGIFLKSQIQTRDWLHYYYWPVTVIVSLISNIHTVPYCLVISLRRYIEIFWGKTWKCYYLGLIVLSWAASSWGIFHLI